MVRSAAIDPRNKAPGKSFIVEPRLAIIIIVIAEESFSNKFRLFFQGFNCSRTSTSFQKISYIGVGYSEFGGDFTFCSLFRTFIGYFVLIRKKCFL